MAICPNCFEQKEFFAGRCPHCIQQVPLGEQFQAELVYTGVQVILLIVFLFVLWLFFG